MILFAQRNGATSRSPGSKAPPNEPPPSMSITRPPGKRTTAASPSPTERKVTRKSRQRNRSQVHHPASRTKASASAATAIKRQRVKSIRQTERALMIEGASVGDVASGREHQTATKP